MFCSAAMIGCITVTVGILFTSVLLTRIPQIFTEWYHHTQQIYSSESVESIHLSASEVALHRHIVNTPIISPINIPITNPNISIPPTLRLLMTQILYIYIFCISVDVILFFAFFKKFIKLICEYPCHKVVILCLSELSHILSPFFLHIFVQNIFPDSVFDHTHFRHSCPLT